MRPLPDDKKAISKNRLLEKSKKDSVQGKAGGALGTVRMQEAVKRVGDLQ